MNFEAKTIQYVDINRAQTMDIVDVGAISFTTRIKADLNVLFANSNLTSGTFDISNTNREQYIENTVSDFNQRLPYYQNTVQNGEFLFFLKHDLQTIFNKNVDVNQSLMNVDLIELNTFKVLNQIVDNGGALNKKFLNSTQLKEICIELQHRNDATDGYSGLTFYSGDSISTIVHIRDSDIAGSPWHIYTLQIDHREGEIVADDVIGTWDNSVSILTNDFWNFYYNWIYDTNDIKSIVPEVDNDTDLGSSVLRFRDIHFAGDLNDSISLSSTAIVPTVSNQTNIGSPTLMFNDIYMNGTMNGYSFTSSAFLPEQNNQTNLGSATFLFKDLYLSGKVNGIKLTDTQVFSVTDDYTNLGTSNFRFKDLYLSGTVNGVSISDSSVNGLVIASDGSSVLPSVSATTDLGSTEKTFKDIYISNTLRFGNASVFLDMYTDDYLNVYPGINVNGLQVTNHNSRKVVFHNETRSAYRADLGMWNRPFNDMYLSGALNSTSISSGTINNIMTIDENNNRVVPVLDSSIDLGNGSLRWNDIYSLNAPINSSDRNLKKNIIDSDLGLDFIEKLRPVRFQFKDGTRPHYGMIAQEVRDVINDMKKDFAGYIQGYQTTKVDILDEKTNEKIGEKTETSETPYYALRYTEFIAPLIQSVQELTQRVQELEKKLTS